MREGRETGRDGGGLVRGEEGEMWGGEGREVLTVVSVMSSLAPRLPPLEVLLWTTDILQLI